MASRGESKMGRRGQLPTLARLELSQTVYDEIERKLLEAGHEHRFWRGPGTAIDMTGIWVEPMAADAKPPRAAVHKGMVMAGLATSDMHYCFACDRVVTQPCERVDCMEAAKEAAS
jgi:hypothetical protein